MHSRYVRLGVGTQSSNLQWSRKTNRAPILGSTQRRDMEQTLCICHPKNRKELSTFSISKHILRSLTRQACAGGRFINGKWGQDLGKGQLSHRRAPHMGSRNSDAAPTSRSPQGRMGSNQEFSSKQLLFVYRLLSQDRASQSNHLELTTPLPQALWHGITLHTVKFSLHI